MNYFDLLPEELIQHIWKFIYNDNLEGIISSLIGIGFVENNVIRTTIAVEKRQGYYYNILKRDYNVVLFNRKYRYFHCPERYNDDINITRCNDNSLINLTTTYPCDYNYSNVMRKTYDYNKKHLQKMLKDNGYKLYDGTTGPYKYVGDMFKSWTRDRLIRELMSF
jgi:hypothetical protein